MNVSTLSRAAEFDLEEIWLYLRRHASEAIADGQIKQIHRRAEMLASSPMMGQACEELSVGFRCFPSDKYIIYYRPMATGIEIIRVLHGSRNIERSFFW